MKPYYERDGITLILGDCLQVLPTMAAGSFDCILTDPPFGVREDDWDDMSNQEFARFSMAWLSQVRRLVNNGIIFCTQGSILFDLCKPLFDSVRRLIWNKPYGSQYAGASRHKLWYAYETILHCSPFESWSVVQPKARQVAILLKEAREKAGLSRGGVDMVIRGKKTGLCYRWEESACLPTPEQVAKLKAFLPINGEFDSALKEAMAAKEETLEKAAEKAAEYTDVFSYRTLTGGIHPCEKPIGLLIDLLSTALDGKTRLFDPFAGSGTTGLAAWRLGRKCTLIEIEERYAEIAARRIDAEISRGRLFAPEPEPIEQATMDFSE